jgi:hypothetical protein
MTEIFLNQRGPGQRLGGRTSGDWYQAPCLLPPRFRLFRFNSLLRVSDYSLFLENEINSSKRSIDIHLHLQTAPRRGATSLEEK